MQGRIAMRRSVPTVFPASDKFGKIVAKIRNIIDAAIAAGGE